MPIVKLLYQNRGLAGTWTASGAVSTLPAANLADANRGKVWRTTGSTGTSTSTGEWAKVDLGAAYTIDAVALVSGNLSTAAVITIKARTTDGDWTTPAFSTSLTPWSAPITGVLVAFLSASQTYEWWRFDVSDTGNSTGYIQLGLVALGPIVSFAAAPNQISYQTIDPSPIGYAASGTPKAFSLNPYAEVDLTYNLLDETTLVFGALQTAVRQIGRKNDGVLSVFSTGPSASGIAKSLNVYGRLTDTPAFPYAIPNQWGWRAAFRESL